MYITSKSYIYSLVSWNTLFFLLFFDTQTNRSLLQTGPLGGSNRKKNDESTKSEKKVKVVEMA